MTEDRIDERMRSLEDVSSTERAPLDLNGAESSIRRFTVNGFKRVPRAFVPTIAIGAIVVIVATVIFVADILGK
jgi:hypothetical protein